MRSAAQVLNQRAAMMAAVARHAPDVPTQQHFTARSMLFRGAAQHAQRGRASYARAFEEAARTGKPDALYDIGVSLTEAYDSVAGLDLSLKKLKKKAKGVVKKAVKTVASRPAAIVKTVKDPKRLLKDVKKLPGQALRVAVAPVRVVTKVGGAVGVKPLAKIDKKLNQATRYAEKNPVKVLKYATGAAAVTAAAGAVLKSVTGAARPVTSPEPYTPPVVTPTPEQMQAQIQPNRADSADLITQDTYAPPPQPAPPSSVAPPTVEVGANAFQQGRVADEQAMVQAQGGQPMTTTDEDGEKVTPLQASMFGGKAPLIIGGAVAVGLLTYLVYGRRRAPAAAAPAAVAGLRKRRRRRRTRR